MEDIDTEPVLVGSDERLNKTAGEALTVNPGAPGLTGPAFAAQTGRPEFPKKFWKGAIYATGHWYNRASPWSWQALTPALSQGERGTAVADGAVLFLNLVVDNGRVGIPRAWENNRGVRGRR